MYEYTIDGTTYYATGTLFVPTGEEHTLEEIDSRIIYLYDSPEYPDSGEALVKLDWPGERYRAVQVIPMDQDAPPEHYVVTEAFGTARPVQAVVADGLNECPDCGRPAGSEDVKTRCVHCGYGIDIGDDDESGVDDESENESEPA